MKFLLMEISFDLPERTRKLCEFPKSVLVKADLEFSVTKGVKHGQEQARGLQSVLGFCREEEFGMDSGMAIGRKKSKTSVALRDSG